VIFLDTNVLLYSISRADDEASKRRRAIELLDRDDCALSVQVLQEFYVQATRASRSDALPHDTAAGLVRTWLRFPIQSIDVKVMEGALEIRAAHGYSYWDSAVVASACALGCNELMSEDMRHGHTIDSVTVVDPFRSTPR
jgi:predicted nucleic acid-binding protein